jgi:DNA polymerase-3 subunit chi
MTQINFYNLPQDTEQMRKLFACRLTEKARSLGHRVCLFAGSEELAREIDALLWSFSSTSFIPHEIVAADGTCAEDVCIAVTSVPKDANDVVINLTSDALGDVEGIARVNEIIIQEPEALEQARARYRHYQQAGIRPEMIKL